jgi:hypothetical protein
MKRSPGFVVMRTLGEAALQAGLASFPSVAFFGPPIFQGFIQPGAYTVGVCAAFKGGKQQEAIVAKISAQAA